MKKVLFALAFGAFAFTANAQWNSGSIMVTGNLGFSSGSSNNETGATTTDLFSTSTFNVGVNGGYFVADNLAVGLNLGFQNSSIKDEQADQTTTTNMMMYGVFGRYYVPYTEQFSMYANLGFGLANGSTEVDDNNNASNSDNSSLGVGVGVGAAYFLNDHFFLDINYGVLGYSSTSSTSDPGGANESTNNASSFGLNLDWGALTFGMGILL